LSGNDLAGGSLLISILMHLSLTGSILCIFRPLAIPELPLLTWYMTLVVALWGLVGVVIMTEAGGLRE
jgi:hypothetical protein